MRHGVLAGAVMLVHAWIGGPAAGDDVRELRLDCWDLYQTCVLGAAGEEIWRTTCYSDFTACMRPAGPTSCQRGDRVICNTFRNDCLARAYRNPAMQAQCESDMVVCFEAHGC